MGLYAKDRSYSYANDLREIRALGADHVSLVVSWYQKTIRSNKIHPYWEPLGDFETTPDEKIAEIASQAHREGLRVFLFPILRIEERKDKEWRGVIAPSNLKKWLASYKAFTLHYARLAQKNQIELFSVGSELCSMESHAAYWQKLIADIRQFYPGKLLYSANWDHYKKISFWNALDYLGLNGYYEVGSDDQPNLQDLLRKWWDIENELNAWQESLRKKIVFTEIGYPSLDGGCRKPWDYTRETAVDLDEQALCYEAFFLSWANKERLGGVYFWNWYGQGGVNDRSYTPRGKPAEKILAKWFRNRSWHSSPSSPSPPVEEPQQAKIPGSPPS